MKYTIDELTAALKEKHLIIFRNVQEIAQI